MPSAVPPQPGAPPLAWLQRRWAAPIAAVFILPFLFVTIPPLIDVPGHIGRMAVAAAPADSPLAQYFGFRWAPVLNLGTDLLVELLRPWIGLMPAVWLLCAITPVLTAAGVLAIARTANRQGGHAVPWALLFVFNWPFFYGFLNFSFTASLSLLAFALWLRLEGRAGLRAALFVPIAPLLLVSHAVGGGLLLLLAGSHEVWRRQAWRPSSWSVALLLDLVRTLWPLFAVLVPLALWFGLGSGGSGRNRWLLERKPEALLMALRDQNMILDIASVAAAFAVLALGRFWGARLRGGAAGPAIVLFLLLLFIPSIMGSADRIDTRIAPYVPLIALALQDWSTVAPNRRTLVAAAGAMLLAVRLVVTTVGFMGYERSYASELVALDQVRPGSRILNFVAVGCKITDWRTHRLEHLPNLATPTRNAWINSHWVIDGVNLLEVRYKPDDYHWRDPSEVVFEPHCVDAKTPPDKRRRKTVEEAVARAPLARVDYVWLVNGTLTDKYSGPPLDKLWSNGTSELYAVRAPVPNRRITP